MDIIGLASLGELVSRVLGFGSYRLKRQAAKREELREVRERPELSLYLSDGATELTGDAEYRIWRFSLLVTNRSDRENSVVRAECRISYRTTGAHIHNVTIPNRMDPRGQVGSNRELELPMRLDGRAAKAGVLSFGASNSTLAGHDIVGYTLTIEDAYGKEYKVEAIMVMEVPGEDD